MQGITELQEHEEAIWKKMFFLWERLNVPAVRTRNFMVGRHTVRSPWFSLVDNTQVPSDTKSLNRTAKHLAVDFAEKESELIAAYKIYSFLKTYYGVPTPFSRILILIMKKHSVYEGNLWFASAKWVIPNVNGNPYQFEDEIENKDWMSTVLAAAEAWIKIAEEWEILIIPEYTAKDSELNKQLDRLDELWHNNEDFRKFIQLRSRLERTLDKEFKKLLT